MIVRDLQTERFVKKNKPFFDALLAGSDIYTSISQIQQSNKAIRELQRPSMPSPNVLDPALNNQIAKAQQGTLDAARALEPAKAGIDQQRALDIDLARRISGGQAGALGAQATGASLRAMRESAKLPQIRDAIRAREQGRADNLIGLRQGVLQDEFQNRLAIGRTNLDQYQNDVAAAAALGQAGRTNLRMTLGQLPDMLTRTAGNMMPVQDVWDAYGANVENNLAQTIAKFNPGPVSRPGFTSPTLSTQPMYGGVQAAQQARNARLQPLQNYTANQISTPALGYPQRLPSRYSRVGDRRILENPNTSGTRERYEATKRFYSNNY